jgi:hypothetical protein
VLWSVVAGAELACAEWPQADDQVDVADGLLEGDVIAVDGGRYLWLAELQDIKGGVGCADGH